MALFGGKTKKTEEKAKKEIVAVSHTSSSNLEISDTIINPRITEKSHSLAESSNVYSFNVKAGATKGAVRKAIKDLYKVAPLKIAVIKVPKKTRYVRGKIGVSGGGRKAYVYLKRGDKLEIN